MSAFSGLDKTFFTRLNCFCDNFDVASGSMIILELFRACLHIWHAKLDSAMDIASTGWPPYVQLKEKKQSFFVAYSINHTFYSWQIFKTNGCSSCICIKKADPKENLVLGIQSKEIEPPCFKALWIKKVSTSASFTQK